MATMPKQKPGRSKQDYQTPKEFIDIFQKQFGPIVFDLAAHQDNYVHKDYYGVGGIAEDSLTQDWTKLVTVRNDSWLWLNPPYGNIKPWAKKCAETLQANPLVQIAMLVPASVGSNWYRDYVYKQTCVFALNPRLSFDGKHPFPKDCILALYSSPTRFEFPIGSFNIWCWDK